MNGINILYTPNPGVVKKETERNQVEVNRVH